MLFLGRQVGGQVGAASTLLTESDPSSRIFTDFEQTCVVSSILLVVNNVRSEVQGAKQVLMCTLPKTPVTSGRLTCRYVAFIKCRALSWR